MSGTTRRVGAGTTVATTAARAVLAALLALVTTFYPQPERTAAFGLVVLGAFLALQGVVLAVGLRRSPEDRTGRVLGALRAIVSLGGGVVALAGVERGIALLLPLEAVVFLAVGLLEFAAGMRRAGAGTAGDAIVVGGLQALVGVLLIVLNSSALFAIGVLTAWGAVVAVYLGIAAVNLRRRAAP